jgi:hypothetical protein
MRCEAAGTPLYAHHCDREFKPTQAQLSRVVTQAHAHSSNEPRQQLRIEYVTNSDLISSELPTTLPTPAVALSPPSGCQRACVSHSRAAAHTQKAFSQPRHARHEVVCGTVGAAAAPACAAAQARACLAAGSAPRLEVSVLAARRARVAAARCVSACWCSASVFIMACRITTHSTWHVWALGGFAQQRLACAPPLPCKQTTPLACMLRRVAQGAACGHQAAGQRQRQGAAAGRH